MYQVISLELPHRTSLQVFLACIPDKTFVFSVAIMQSSFPFCRRTFTFSFFSLYSFSKQTLFLHAPYAVVEVFSVTSLADGFSSAALSYDFFRHQDLLNLLASSLSALLVQQILLVVIFLPSSHFHHYFFKSKQYLV